MGWGASRPLLLDPLASAYDAVGNRMTGGSVVNPGNQLTADTNHTYQYDDNGNLIRKTLLATGNYTQYTYDAENRLTQVQEFAAGNPTAITTSTYCYDGLGRRIEKVANGQTKRYVYDGEDIVLEYDGANVLQARYTHGPGIDEPIAVTKAGSTFYYHQDGLGTVTELTDTNGSVAKAYAYDAYGNILESPGTVDQPYTYTGREFDIETGLYYYRARYYDAGTGRFLQKDPLMLGGGDENVYRYVANNPAKYIDPTGLRLTWPSGTSEQHSQDIQTALNYLRQDSGMAKIIQNLEDSSTVYTIVPSTLERNLHESNYNQILWNPNLANCLIGGGTQSPALILGHELSHAEGGLWADILRQFQDSEFGTKEERRVITGPETRAALTLGEGIRSSHQISRQYYVPTPSSR